MKIIRRNDHGSWASPRFQEGTTRAEGATENRAVIPAPWEMEDGQRYRVESNMEAGQSDFTGPPRDPRIC